MQMGTVSQCTSRLDFQPLQPWPAALPSIAWQNVLIAGFHTSASHPCCHLEGDLLQALQACYREITLPELARLFQTAGRLHLQLDWPALVEAYSLRWSDNLQMLLEVLVSTPMAFQAWVSERKLAAKDLAVLRAMPIDTTTERLLLEIVRAAPTRSQGAQILEMACELLLLGKTDCLLTEGESAEAWLERLSQARRPITATRDDIAQARVAALPWPQSMRARWVRQGDLGRIEVHFSFANAPELGRRIEGLQRVLEQDLVL